MPTFVEVAAVAGTAVEKNERTYLNEKHNS
jgi:hypothetical protein